MRPRAFWAASRDSERKASRPTQLTAGEQGGLDRHVVGAARAGLVEQVELLLVLQGLAGGKLVGVLPHHQGLAVADEDVVAAVALGHHTGLDQLVQFGHQRVPLVPQVVGLVVVGGTFGDGNLLVHGGDFRGEGVDLLDHAGELGIDAAAQVAEAAVQGVHPGHQGLGGADHGLAGGNGTGIGRHLAHPLEERGQGGGKTGSLVRQHVVDLADLVEIGLELVLLGFRLEHLVVQELAEDAPHVAHVHAVADKAGAGELGSIGGLDGLLTAIAFGVDVGDIVLGGEDARLSRAQCADADSVDACHGLCSPASNAFDRAGPLKFFRQILAKLEPNK